MKLSKEGSLNSIFAKAQFLSDRTCCVCRVTNKPIQIHHIDSHHSNNDINNVAVLCLDCHTETQIKGGFHRKLNSDLVILYRDDWHKLVASKRAKPSRRSQDQKNYDIELVTNTLEIYRTRNLTRALASEYNSIGNAELRDLYIEESLKNHPTDHDIIYLRSMQGKLDLIPLSVIKREISKLENRKDWNQLARVYGEIGDHKNTAKYHIMGILESLENGNIFSAAYYLKELTSENEINSLFELALTEFSDKNDLHGQVRTLQELGWKEELKNLLITNEKKINRSNALPLKIELARAKKDRKKVLSLEKEFASRIKYHGDIVYLE